MIIKAATLEMNDAAQYLDGLSSDFFMLQRMVAEGNVVDAEKYYSRIITNARKFNNAVRMFEIAVKREN